LKGAAVIEAVGLTKFYGDVIAVGDLSSQVDEGELLVLLGESGFGKTITLNKVN
jgi:ABC-type sugar transport system ATPase subunit